MDGDYHAKLERGKFLCGPLRFSAISAFMSDFQRRDRRGPQRAAEICREDLFLLLRGIDAGVEDVGVG